MNNKLFPKEEKDTWILREKDRKGKNVGRRKILIKFQTIRRNLIKSGAITAKEKIKNEPETEAANINSEGCKLRRQNLMKTTK